MLRITKSSDPITVEQLVLCVYSPPGVGKSSLAFTAEDALLLDFDGGAYRAGNRGDVVSVSSWSDAASITADDVKGYKTLILDTAGRALDALTTDVISGNPKLGRSGGALTLQGYGELKARFIAYTKLVRSFGLDLILLAHSDEQRGNHDDLIERIDVQGGSKNEIYKAADVMGRLSIRQGQRLLNFSPTDTAFGKNPGQLPEIVVPNFQDEPQFLAGVIEKIKDTLNRLTAAQQATAKALIGWQERLGAAPSADALNKLIPEATKAEAGIRDNVKRLVVKIGKAKGFEWDKEAKQFAVEKSNGFNPLSQTTKDGLTQKQAKNILKLTGELKLDADDTAAKLFKVPDLKADDLSKEAAEMLIADLTARVESEEETF